MIVRVFALVALLQAVVFGQIWKNDPFWGIFLAFVYSLTSVNETETTWIFQRACSKKKVLKKSKNKNYGTIFTLWHPQNIFISF